ncbi:hypothetical protein [Streptomyces violascens]|uniref:hypothetical protein n=1 Tax=Streptomyces violascens TaxID=67381 RepID=UPI00167A4E6D|nr:hypothetical protein [Streptomyces violascens]
MDARRLMDQIAAFGEPGPLFVITGGDPFQRADLNGHSPPVWPNGSAGRRWTAWWSLCSAAERVLDRARVPG